MFGEGKEEARKNQREIWRKKKMGMMSKAGDLTFKAFSAGLGLATIYLTATFSLNVYKGLAWHNAQTSVKLLSSDSLHFTWKGKKPGKTIVTNPSELNGWRHMELD